MATKRSTKRLPKLSNAERHKCFVEMAREVEASDDHKDFDEAFDKVIMKVDSKKRSKPHLKSS